MCGGHWRRNIKTIEGAYSAECQSPGTKGGSLNLTGFNDRCQAELLGGHMPPVPPWFLRLWGEGSCSVQV